MMQTGKLKSPSQYLWVCHRSTFVRLLVTNSPNFVQLRLARPTHSKFSTSSTIAYSLCFKTIDRIYILAEIIAFLEFVTLIFHVRTVHKFPHRVLAMLKVKLSRGSRKWTLKNNLSQGRRCLLSPSTSCAISLPAFLIEESHTYKILTDNQHLVLNDELLALSVNMKQPRGTNANYAKNLGF